MDTKKGVKEIYKKKKYCIECTSFKELGMNNIGVKFVNMIL